MISDIQIRSLTKEEQDIYSGACIHALGIVPAFRDGISLLRPFYDGTAKTAYTDPYSRVGLSKWFFESLNYRQRSSVVLHEVMHVLNSHFVRGEIIGANNESMNISGDFEINSGLDLLPNIKLEFAIFPNKGEYDYPPNLSMEKYFHLLKLDNKHQGQDSQNGDGAEGEGSEGQGQGQGQGSDDSQSQNGQQGQGQGQEDSEGAGTGHHCDSSTESRSSAADKAGIPRASESEQSIARKNTTVRVQEELNKAKSRGDGTSSDFLSLVIERMSPPKVSWQTILRRTMSKLNDAIVRGRIDYSYRRVNRRYSTSDFVFPGMISYVPKLMFGIDTSGSMSKPDYVALMNEVEGIIKASKRTKGGFAVFCIDTVIQNVKTVSSVKSVNLQGGGGTDMSVGLAYINSLHKKERPDLFILATDGFTCWNSYENELRIMLKNNVSHVLLITSHAGFAGVPKSIKSLVTVIDIADDAK